MALPYEGETKIQTDIKKTENWHILDKLEYVRHSC